MSLNKADDFAPEDPADAFSLLLPRVSDQLTHPMSGYRRLVGWTFATQPVARTLWAQKTNDDAVFGSIISR